MGPALSRLSASLTASLRRFKTETDSGSLADFPALAGVGEALSLRYDKVKTPIIPPKDKRHKALKKFRADAEPLSRAEWRLVFYSLAEDDTTALPVLEDDQLFWRIHQKVATGVEQKSLARKDWLALCYSYFAYGAAAPEANQNWRQLRDDIGQAFEALRRWAPREKEWMRIVQQHRDLFGDQAGEQLAEDIFLGRTHDLTALQAIAQIEKPSWLWQRIFSVIILRIRTLEDEVFLERLPELIALGKINERFMSPLLSACLTRYYDSPMRERSSALLKQAALEHWGSPQVRSKQNLWLNHVSEPVCAMVVAWFAKEDLEHFFTLLKGGTDVDQSRLFYWLRYANQMSYTRIIMGSDAWHHPGSDFVQFRRQNHGRLSQLTGGLAHNNAVVMQIGNYFFVEFSGTGNACYVYRADIAPFDPEKKTLALATELKQKGRELKRMPHSPAPRRPDLVEGWLEKFDSELRSLGITASANATPSPHLSPRAQLNLTDQLAALLDHVDYQLVDNRSRGGALQVKLDRVDARAEMALQRLGFRPMNKNPLAFWKP